jgi:protein TonB
LFPLYFSRGAGNAQNSRCLFLYECKEQRMFEQSLVEIPQDTRNRKRWTAMLSFSLEATAVLVLLSFPLVHTEVLPPIDRHIAPPYTRFVPDHVRLISEQIERRSSAPDRPVINILLPPRTIADHIDRSPDPAPPSAPDDGCVGCIAIPNADGGPQNSVIADMMHRGPAIPVHRAPVAPIARSSTMQEGLLIRQIKPVYPPMAIAARIQGKVELHAMISRDGRIETLQVVSGHPMLVRAALDAVKQWLYRPYVLNGEPVAVETQITVNFTLNGQ